MSSNMTMTTLGGGAADAGKRKRQQDRRKPRDSPRAEEICRLMAVSVHGFSY
jgi:hypothetical protein